MKRQNLIMTALTLLAVSGCYQESEQPAPMQQETPAAMQEPAKAPPMEEKAPAAKMPAAPKVTTAKPQATPMAKQEEPSAKEAGTMATATITGDAAKGAKIAKSKCAMCHFLDADRKKVGPSLKGIYGRAPSIEGVPYAKWDDMALDAFLKNPKAVKPKTKMAFSGLGDERARHDLIAYLKTL